MTTRPLVLTPVAVAARGGAAVALAQRLLALSDETLATLDGVAGKDLLAVTGSSDALPWVDGVVYLGRHPDAAGVLFVTHAPPPTAPHLLAAALLRQYPGQAPLALLGADVIPLGGARPVARSQLLAWLQRAEAAP